MWQRLIGIAVFCLFASFHSGSSLGATADVPTKYRIVGIDSMEELRFGRLRLNYSRHCYEGVADLLTERVDTNVVNAGILVRYKQETCRRPDREHHITVRPRGDTIVSKTNFAEVWHCEGYCQVYNQGRPSYSYGESFGISDNDARNKFHCGGPIVRMQCEQISVETGF